MVTPGAEFAGIVADADPVLSGHERRVLRVLAAVSADRLLTLDGLSELVYPGDSHARRYVFAAVASLEDIGYLTRGKIR